MYLKSSACEGFLGNYIGTEEYEFLFINSRTGTHLKGIHTGWDLIRKKAGLPMLRIHDLRHSFASMLDSGGADALRSPTNLGAFGTRCYSTL